MSPTLAIDLGGTRIRAALVEGARVLDRAETDTDRDGGATRWIDQIGALAGRWAGGFSGAGVSVTGIVLDGRWMALNPETLPVPDGFPLAERVEAVLGMRPVLANDAHAAAWGEFVHGAGQGRDMVFLTISTGVGGGVVLGGRLLTGRSGLAGHVGQLLSPDGAERFEDTASGRCIARLAKEAGHDGDARSVFDAAAAGQGWANDIVGLSAARVGVLCRNLQLLYDPDVIVIGGGVGLAEGYLGRVRSAFEELPAHFRPSLARAALGADAGVIGVAALATPSGSN